LGLRSVTGDAGFFGGSGGGDAELRAAGKRNFEEQAEHWTAFPARVSGRLSGFVQPGQAMRIGASEE
jgi:hypothetical protein